MNAGGGFDAGTHKERRHWPVGSMIRKETGFMEAQGRCYCGAVRYKASGDPVIQAQCHCRECQYVSGGSPNVTIGMPEAGFAYTKGQPKQFRRKDLPQPVTREFCAECGTQILTRAPAVPGEHVVYAVEGTWSIVDLGSSNGTYVVAVGDVSDRRWRRHPGRHPPAARRSRACARARVS